MRFLGPLGLAIENLDFWVRRGYRDPNGSQPFLLLGLFKVHLKKVRVPFNSHGPNHLMVLSVYEGSINSELGRVWRMNATCHLGMLL